MNGICTSTSISMVPAAMTTTRGAWAERRQASTAAAAAGTGTVAASHTPGKTQLVRPSGAIVYTGGVLCPARSISAPPAPANATTVSVTTSVRGCGHPAARVARRAWSLCASSHGCCC